jgi:predicted RNA-binding Zn-ribbon protein involved in translation (DUF1610 family)
MVRMVDSVRSLPRACLVCGSQLPPDDTYASWLCPECLVVTDADATRPPPVDFRTALGRADKQAAGAPSDFSPSAA